MNKRFISLILAIVMVMGITLPSYAEETYSSPKKDSAQLQYQDMLMLFCFLISMRRFAGIIFTR
ncbi:hypothetical protein [Paenibacillus sp. MDMC362]|uniref:hypothetical protein n=1 Tax=Paenibacillus sp. MDMC362 TaxID=2977365 RepID=UPI0021A6C314|nr:hypothetical protein [Paenibacillus sp. MDMC362]